MIFLSIKLSLHWTYVISTSTMEYDEFYKKKWLNRTRQRKGLGFYMKQKQWEKVVERGLRWLAFGWWWCCVRVFGVCVEGVEWWRSHASCLKVWSAVGGRASGRWGKAFYSGGASLITWAQKCKASGRFGVFYCSPTGGRHWQHSFSNRLLSFSNSDLQGKPSNKVSLSCEFSKIQRKNLQLKFPPSN